VLEQIAVQVSAIDLWLGDVAIAPLLLYSQMVQLRHVLEGVPVQRAQPIIAEIPETTSDRINSEAVIAIAHRSERKSLPKEFFQIARKKDSRKVREIEGRRHSRNNLGVAEE